MPNITAGTGLWGANFRNTAGAFYEGVGERGNHTANTGTNINRLEFNAARSSRMYKDNAHYVLPTSIQIRVKTRFK